MKFAERLRELRKEKGLTQAELAKEFKVDRTTLKDWETRGNQPSFEMLCLIAKFFEVSVDYLLGMID